MDDQFATASPDAIWRGTDFPTKSHVTADLSYEALGPERAPIRALAQAGREPHTITQDELPLTACADQLATLREQTLHSRAFAILRGITVGSVTPEETELLF
jgi:hypothetical protein